MSKAITKFQPGGLGTISAYRSIASFAGTVRNEPPSRKLESDPCVRHGMRAKKSSEARNSDSVRTAAEIRSYPAAACAPEAPRTRSRGIDEHGLNPLELRSESSPSRCVLALPETVTSSPCSRRSRWRTTTGRRVLDVAAAPTSGRLSSGSHRSASHGPAERTHHITVQFSQHNRAFGANSPHNRASWAAISPARLGRSWSRGPLRPSPGFEARGLLNGVTLGTLNGRARRRRAVPR